MSARSKNSARRPTSSWPLFRVKVKHGVCVGDGDYDLAESYCDEKYFGDLEKRKAARNLCQVTLM